MKPNKALQATATALAVDQFMKLERHHCSQAQSPVAVPELIR